MKERQMIDRLMGFATTDISLSLRTLADSAKKAETIVTNLTVLAQEEIEAEMHPSLQAKEDGETSLGVLVR